MSTWALLVTATLASCASFAGCYLLARKLNNYGIVDIAWSYAFTALGGFFALAGSGWTLRRGIVAAMMSIWSLRLGTHLLVRVAGHHPREDARYAQLRTDWAGHFAEKMFGFFQLQAVSVVILGVVMVFPAQNPQPQFHAFELAGVALWLGALLGEAVADAQLAGFKRLSARRGHLCTVGVWRYSRHPNYFFEWVIWVGYSTFALGSPLGWIGLIAPAVMLYLLLRVTGIPQAEAQSLRRLGDSYRRYQQVTSAFVPWPPRKPAAGRPR